MIAVDLDDTLSDARWRQSLWGRWDEYYAEAHMDPPNVPFVRLVRAMAMCGMHVVILTPREERYRPSTVAWLMGQGVFAHDLRMRPEGNYQPEPDLKLSLAADLMPAIEMLIDDNEDVLTAFRRHNVPTLHAIPAREEP